MMMDLIKNYCNSQLMKSCRITHKTLIFL